MPKKPRSSKLTNKHQEFFQAVLELVPHLHPKIRALGREIGTEWLPQVQWHHYYAEPFPKLLKGQMEQMNTLRGQIMSVESKPDALALLEPILALYGYLVALNHNIRCIEIHSVSLNRLVQEGNAGNRAALLDAVLIDKSLVSYQPFAKIISTASLNNPKFLQKLAASIDPRSNPARNKATYLNPLRLLVAMLYEYSDLKPSTSELITFLEPMGLYQFSDSESLRKELQKLKSKHIGKSNATLPATE